MEGIATSVPTTAEGLARLLADPQSAWPRRTWALLDVREHGAFERGHVAGATALPRRRLEFRIRELVPDRETPVLVYDEGEADTRAARAADDLRAFGYGGARSLEGGIAGWRALGGVLAHGVNVPCKAFGERVLAEDGVRHLDAEALVARRASGARIALCDVRTPDEFATAHLPGAQSAPGFELALRLGDLEAEHETVVVNCAGRTRSIIGAATLARLGARSVFAFENGTMGWRLSGRELESGGGDDARPASAQSRATAAVRAAALAKSVGVALLEPSAAAALMLEASGGLRILDVRDAQAFSAGHISGATFAPGGQAVQRADDFIAVPGAPVLFVDDGDARALLAAYWFRRMGFPRVYVLQGGMPAWHASGRQVEAGRPRPQPLDLASARAAVAFVDAGRLASRLAAPAGAGLLLLDVGSSRDLKSGHVAGAVWVPRGSLEEQIGGIASRDRPVVLASREEAQSVYAARTLARLGFRQVEVLAGGTTAWRDAGLPLVEGLPTGVSEEDVVEPPYRRGLAGMRSYLDWEIALHSHDTPGGHEA